jgi:NAD(P)-dependent dehydrogenase (short-subunit alcohol dehydrogenase family)
LWGWAKTAANELTESGVTLNLVCPGAHATERIVELGRQRAPASATLAISAGSWLFCAQRTRPT